MKKIIRTLAQKFKSKHHGMYLSFHNRQAIISCDVISVSTAAQNYKNIIQKL